MGSRATTKRTQPAIAEGVSPSPRQRCEEGQRMCVQHYTRNVRYYMHDWPLRGTLNMKGWSGVHRTSGCRAHRHKAIATTPRGARTDASKGAGCRRVNRRIDCLHGGERTVQLPTTNRHSCPRTNWTKHSDAGSNGVQTAVLAKSSGGHRRNHCHRAT